VRDEGSIRISVWLLAKRELRTQPLFTFLDSLPILPEVSFLLMTQVRAASRCTFSLSQFLAKDARIKAVQFEAELVLIFQQLKAE